MRQAMWYAALFSGTIVAARLAGRALARLLLWAEGYIRTGITRWRKPPCSK